MDNEKNIEIPFGANDSELGGWEYTIPEGFEAVIEDGKVIVRKTESEDEKIRKDILAYLKGEFGDGKKQLTPYTHEIPKWYAWLEKQGEQKPVAMIQWTGDNLKEVVEFTGKSPNFDKWFKSQEEYEGYVRSHNNIFKLFNEDGSYCEIPVGAWIIKTPDGYNVASKFRFVPKPVEWSEEDENRLTSVIEDMEDYYEHEYNKHNSEWTSMENRRIVLDEINRNILWLKSLHPQKQWKPSEEQIQTLEYYMRTLTCNEHKEVLFGLMEQLKALRNG